MKDNEKATVVKKKEKVTVWYNFFVKYLLFGLFLILLSVYYNAELRQLLINYSLLQKILDGVSSVAGILGPSLVVASLFTFSIESNNFIEYIKDKIERVMIKKEFLDKLNEGDKRDALKRILTPSDENFQIFSNIKNYFEETITKSMTLFDCTFKSNFTIDINAAIQNNRVCFDETICQRLYRGKNGFEPIKVGFVDSENGIEFGYVQYIYQNGEIVKLTEEDFDISNREEDDGFKWKMYSYKIPETIEDEFISVIIKYKEFGYDHWLLFNFKTLIASEGIKVTVNCFDDLVIKDHLIFDNDKHYIRCISEDKRKLEISTSQWISPGNGVSVLIAKAMTSS
jgi:hypothetical protein